jgi:ribosomal protein S25
VKVQVKKTRRARAQELQQLSRERKRLKQATMHHKEALLKGQKEEEAAAEAEAAAVDEELVNPVTLNVFSFARQVSPLCHQEGGVAE